MVCRYWPNDRGNRERLQARVCESRCYQLIQVSASRFTQYGNLTSLPASDGYYPSRPRQLFTLPSISSFLYLLPPRRVPMQSSHSNILRTRRASMTKTFLGTLPPSLRTLREMRRLVVTMVAARKEGKLMLSREKFNRRCISQCLIPSFTNGCDVFGWEWCVHLFAF